MRRFGILSLLAAVSSAFASQPGQPLDCSDWVVLEPGITCSLEVAPGVLAEGDPRLTKGSAIVLDNLGREVTLRGMLLDPFDPYVPRRRLELIGRSGAETVVTAAVEDRIVDQPNGVQYDRIRPTSCVARYCGYQDGSWCPVSPPGYCEPTVNIPAAHCTSCGNSEFALRFDPVRGELRIPLHSLCGENGAFRCPLPEVYGEGWWIARFSGFTTLFEILQSYEPNSGGFSLRTPTMPEGFPVAQRFDSYWGAVTHPLDLTDAHPLQCAYPSSLPDPGDYLQITSPVPTPSPGHANYILTSVTYQGQTRAGRQSSGGQLSGRDASRLPACVER